MVRELTREIDDDLAAIVASQERRSRGPCSRSRRMIALALAGEARS